MITGKISGELNLLNMKGTVGPRTKGKKRFADYINWRCHARVLHYLQYQKTTRAFSDGKFSKEL